MSGVNINPVAVSVIRTTHEAHKLRFFSQEKNRNRSSSSRHRHHHHPNSIEWSDALLFGADDNKQTLTAAQTITPFSTLCDTFTHVDKLADQVARHFYDVSSPCTVSVVQARRDSKNNSNDSETGCFQCGDSLWCLLVSMPAAHLRRGNSAVVSRPATDVVTITVSIFVFVHDAIHAMDSVIACCVGAARSVDALVGGLQEQQAGSPKIVADAVAQLSKVSTAIPRDLATYLPLHSDSWLGAHRPPHAMVPLAHFIQAFEYQTLLQLFSLACQEASLVFTHTSASIASQCTLAFRGLMYPLAWPHHFHPLAPASTSAQDWPFPLCNAMAGSAEASAQQRNTGFIAGVALRDLPALLLDHSAASSAPGVAPLELWIVDCRNGAVSRAAPTVRRNPMNGNVHSAPVHRTTVVNLNFPSNIFFKEAWEKARLSLSRVGGSPTEHLRVTPEIRQELLTSTASYWAEALLGNYRQGLSVSRNIVDLDAFVYKTLVQFLSPAGLDADPDGAIRALSLALRRTNLIGIVFAKSMLSLEKLANARGGGAASAIAAMKSGGGGSTPLMDINVVPYWKWGMASSSSSARPVRVKEQHDFYFFFRCCCEKNPDMYKDDSITAAKQQASSGIFNKMGTFFTKAKDSARAAISELSQDRHFSLLVPFVSDPRGSLQALVMKREDERPMVPENHSAHHGGPTATLPNGVTHSLQQISRPTPSSPTMQNAHLAAQYQHENARIEANCRFFPPSLHTEHWMNLYPHAKQAFTTLEGMQRQDRVPSAPLPFDVLCDFSSYHAMLAPGCVDFGSSASGGAGGGAPAILQQISRPGVSPTSPAAAAAVASSPVSTGALSTGAPSPFDGAGVSPATTATPSAVSAGGGGNVPSLFNKISIPQGGGGGGGGGCRSPLEELAAPPPRPEEQQQQQQQPQRVEPAQPAPVKNEESMTALFGPAPGSESEAAAKKKPEIDDFFG